MKKGTQKVPFFTKHSSSFTYGQRIKSPLVFNTETKGLVICVLEHIEIQEHYMVAALASPGPGDRIRILKTSCNLFTDRFQDLNLHLRHLVLANKPVNFKTIREDLRSPDLDGLLEWLKRIQPSEDLTYWQTMLELQAKRQGQRRIPTIYNLKLREIEEDLEPKEDRCMA